jgi:hypothetical protein
MGDGYITRKSSGGVTFDTNVAVQSTSGAKFQYMSNLGVVTNAAGTFHDYNVWGLNNNTTKKIILNNVTTQLINTINTPEFTIREDLFDGISLANSNLVNYSSALNYSNGFLYVGSNSPFDSTKLTKRFENGVIAASSTSYPNIFQLRSNNGFIYAATQFGFYEIYESNLGLSRTYSSTFGSNIAFNQTHLFVVSGGILNSYFKSNGALVNQSSVNSGAVLDVTIGSNGYLFIGAGNFLTRVFQSNLQFASLSVNVGNTASRVFAKDNFVYVATIGGVVRKYHEDNLVFVANTSLFQLYPKHLEHDNNFLYVSSDAGSSKGLTKINLSNFSTAFSLSQRDFTVGNGKIFVSSYGSTVETRTLQVYTTNRTVFNTMQIHRILNIPKGG